MGIFTRRKQKNINDGKEDGDQVGDLGNGDRVDGSKNENKRIKTSGRNAARSVELCRIFRYVPCGRSRDTKPNLSPVNVASSSE